MNVYYDEGISGTRADTRPELQRLMTDCRLRRIDMVLTKSISRFARNTADCCLALVRELISLNIPIHFEKDGIDTSAMESELLLSVMSSQRANRGRFQRTPNGASGDSSVTGPSRYAHRPTATDG